MALSTFPTWRNDDDDDDDKCYHLMTLHFKVLTVSCHAAFCVLLMYRYPPEIVRNCHVY